MHITFEKILNNTKEEMSEWVKHDISFNSYQHGVVHVLFCSNIGSRMAWRMGMETEVDKLVPNYW